MPETFFVSFPFTHEIVMRGAAAFLGAATWLEEVALFSVGVTGAAAEL